MRGVDVLLLGGARLDGPAPLARLDRRTAALLALLAVDGPQPRSRVAGLLWPDSNERTARNNLVQALRRLRTAAAAPVVRGEQVLALDDVDCDVTRLFGSVEREAASSAPVHELLAGYDLDDLPELEAWLREARVRVTRAWAERALERSERCQREGELDEAIAWAEAAALADPIAERGHLRIVRLLLVRGDGPAAMRAYERCKTTLARELGLGPSAAMLDALGAVRASRKAPRQKAPGDSMPALVLRPPRVGRRTEWAALAAAHAQRRGVVVRGEAGLGKTRLVRD